MTTHNNEIAVLYVEDNRENALLMQHIFEGLFKDISLTIAPTAERGLELIENRLFHIILMDIDLPGMDGYEALKRIQQNHLTSHIPVLAVSALATQAQINIGLSAGFSEYITKPLNVKALRQTLGEYLLKVRPEIMLN